MFNSKEFGDILHPSKERALESWARQVRENREQAERFREAPEKSDFYAPTADVFKADPHRSSEPALEALRAMVRKDESWLDIGAGGGRNALPLALLAKEVIAVEPSTAMLKNLRQGMDESGIHNLRIVEGRWPLKERLEADVSLISHVSYDIEDIGPFLNAMEASSRRMCIAVLLDAAPSSLANIFWPQIHGEQRVPLPALREFIVLQIARGNLCELNLSTRNPMTYPNLDLMLSFLRQQLFIEPNGKKDLLLKKILKEQMVEQNGRFALSWKPTKLGIVSWVPR
jgi:SAM-dependent methyltransferase